MHAFDSCLLSYLSFFEFVIQIYCMFQREVLARCKVAVMFHGIQPLLNVDPNLLLEFGPEFSQTSGRCAFDEVPPLSHQTLLCGHESCFLLVSLLKNHSAKTK